MKIDLFTFIAQMVNFGILIWLLNKFLFNRISSVMVMREKRIAEMIASAQKREAHAAELEKRNIAIQAELASRSEGILLQAKIDAEKVRNETLLQVKQDAKREWDRWCRDMLAQKQNFMGELRVRSGKYICSVADKTIKGLADQNLEARVSEVFISRLNNMDDSRAAQFGLLLKESTHAITVKSAFEVEPQLQKKIAFSISRKFGFEGSVEFSVYPGSIYGIELEADNYKVSWSIEEYLDGLEEKLMTIFESQENIQRT